ncbi:MAG: hypothetical protein A2286_03705 [Gammaproteobacteria bacterium RIFOXYA12_FULL_61_12]|nr:MAG: hypothetical protein A2286_03705 [Gammaproteobacteria bacterium RIFOXYA12_FULL_61_12]OGT88504.1 MAG: hypothetical protein A2514_02470 [Gammaproteobacteria bacterium RIFOXYD12_FULL_61_37]
MPRLAARFTIDISVPCLIAWPDGLGTEWTFDIEAFNVILRLKAVDHWRSKLSEDEDWITAIQFIELVISRDELEACPKPIVTPDGKNDLTVQSTFLRTRLPAYQDVATSVSNRFLRFFQYSLHTPLVRPLPDWEHSFHNPKWYREDGMELRGTPTFVAEPVAGLHGTLGAKRLTPSDVPSLLSFLVTSQEPSLSESLLSDAQTAWFEGNFRRAVLELAICAEVMVKRKFFAQASPAGAAFDYLEDKAKVSVRVLELLDSVAQEAFARSYRKEFEANYRAIDNIFRCRNKIAHRGDLSFRDDSGKRVEVDAKLVEAWWASVVNLKTWLSGLS